MKNKIIIILIAVSILASSLQVFADNRQTTEAGSTCVDCVTATSQSNGLNSNQNDIDAIQNEIDIGKIEAAMNLQIDNMLIDFKKRVLVLKTMQNEIGTSLFAKKGQLTQFSRILVDIEMMIDEQETLRATSSIDDTYIRMTETKKQIIRASNKALDIYADFSKSKSGYLKN
jgi:hypothetical protein